MHLSQSALREIAIGLAPPTSAPPAFNPTKFLRRLREAETLIPIARKHGKEAGLAVRMAPLDLGLRLERASLAFWEQIRNSPPTVKP